MVDQLTEDQMSPVASPGELSRKSGVRRVNNLPVYLVGGVMTVFLAIMVLVAADRAAQQNKPNGGPKEKGGNTRLFASEIAGEQKDGIIPPAAAKPLQVPELPTPATADGAVLIARPDNLDTPPKPPTSGRWWHAPERLPRRGTESHPYGEDAAARRGGEGQNHGADGCPAQRRLGARRCGLCRRTG
jgi:hypothetical protein